MRVSWKPRFSNIWHNFINLLDMCTGFHIYSIDSASKNSYNVIVADGRQFITRSL